MKINRLNAQEVLGVLRQGLVSGAVLASNGDFPGLVSRLTNALADVKFRDVSEYEVRTYTLSAADLSCGAVVKIVPRDDERLVRGLSREFALLSELRKAHHASFRTPTEIALLASGDVFVSVAELLQGDSFTEMHITKAAARAVARAITDAQGTISRTAVGRLLIAGSSFPYYIPKLHRFIGNARAGRNIHLREEDFGFAALEAARQNGPMVVSDRSPANFMMDRDGGVDMFDFGLLLVGTPYEDWSWFVDDPRLRTDLTRNELVGIFIESLDERQRPDAETMFHRAAMFVNMKQYCLMSGTKRTAAEHYLSRLRQSAEALSANKVLRLVELLQ